MRSAALAYHTLLGIIPLLGLFFWYLKSIQVTDRWILLTRKFLLVQLNVSSSELFAKYFDKLTTEVQGKSWGWVGVVLLVYTSLSLVFKFGQALDAALDIHPANQQEQLGWFAQLVRRSLALLGLPLALLISLVLSNWIRHNSFLHDFIQVNEMGPFIRNALAWVSTILAVFLVYYFIPSKKIGRRRAWIMACLIGPILQILRILLGVYARYAVSFHKIYGVLAVIPLSILWVQLSWAVLLGGALFLKVVPRSSDAKQR